MQTEIRDYFYKRRSTFLILLTLGVLLLIVREIPFLNIFFPQNTTLSIISLATILMLRWYKSYLFFVFLLACLFVATLLGLLVQTEQAAVFIFVILIALIVDETLSFIKEK